MFLRVGHGPAFFFATPATAPTERMERADSSRPDLPFGDEARNQIARIIGGLGLELCHAAWRPGRNRGVLTLTIDRPGTTVSLDDCENASHAVDALLEGLLEPSSPFVLEVQSPGLDRVLYSLDDCRRFAGRRVRVQLIRPVEGTSRLKGVLEEIRGDEVTVLDEDRSRRYTVRFGDVKVARLVPDL